MNDQDFAKLIEQANAMTPDQKFKLCREMEVVPLSCKFHGELRFPEPPGPMRKLLNEVATTCEVVAETYEGIMRNKFKLANVKLAALLDTDMMSEEKGIVTLTCKALQEYRQNIIDTRSGAKTKFAMRQEENWKSRNKKGKSKAQANNPGKGNKNAKPKEQAPVAAVANKPVAVPKATQVKPVETPPKAATAKPESQKPAETQPKSDEATKKQQLVMAIKKLTGEDVKESLALSTLQAKYKKAQKAKKDAAEEAA